MSDCVQVITMNHRKGREIIQFFSKYIQAALHMVNSAK